MTGGLVDGDAHPGSAAGLVGRLFLDGSWENGAAGTVPVIDPATEEIVGLAAEATGVQAQEATAAASAAQPKWASTAGDIRASVLGAVADGIRSEQDDLVTLMMREGGFTRATCLHGVAAAASWFDRAAQVALRDLSQPAPPEIVQSPAGSVRVNGVLQRRPIGVVACIVPYNGALFGTAMKTAQALALGNAVVVKPPPQNPLAVCQLFRIFERAGLPPGVANLVLGVDPAIGAELVASGNVDMVSFTGSTMVGQKIYESGAKTMKRLVLELGGKGPCIVFDDADLNAAADGLSLTWTVNSGQICSAPSRALVHRRIYEQLMDRMTELARAVVVGSPFDARTVAGPVISAPHRGRVERFVESALADGGELIAAPAHALDRGFFVAPTLIGNCHNDMQAVRDEIFGPVITAIPFDSEDEAIAIANDSEYGLAGYVYSGDSVRAYRVASQIQCGTVHINTVQMKHDLPIGGMKMSGIGREGGDVGLLEFTEMASLVW